MLAFQMIRANMLKCILYQNMFFFFFNENLKPGPTFKLVNDLNLLTSVIHIFLSKCQIHDDENSKRIYTLEW